MPIRIRSTVIVALIVVVSACSSNANSNDASAPTTTAPVTTRARPAGPAASFAALKGGAGISLVSSGSEKKIETTSSSPKELVAKLSAQVADELAPKGWTQQEFSASGNASAYDGETPANGRFSLHPTTKADYVTRVVVRRPTDPAKFNGTVVVEWLNVSGGVDASPDWTYLHDELIRRGYAWVGVSAQHIGVEGGMVAVSTPVSDMAGAGTGLVKLDPARYGSLHHPGDAYSYDIFTQVARGLRDPAALNPLGELVPKHVLAAGESQSAFMLTTYVNGVQPLTKMFDGFLIHSRGAAAAPLGKPNEGIGIANTIGLAPTKIRTDDEAPIIVVETESDVAGLLGYEKARQDDDPKFRLWEVAGTAHVDRYQLGFIADAFSCGNPVNEGPHSYVVKAALAALNTWVTKGTEPPKAPRLAVDDAGEYVTDTDGIVKGGIRTPLVDVPVDRLTGVAAPGGDVACVLAGQTIPLTAAQIAARYASVDDYTKKFNAATDKAIKDGYVLPADRKALLSEAKPDRIAG